MKRIIQHGSLPQTVLRSTVAWHIPCCTTRVRLLNRVMNNRLMTGEEEIELRENDKLLLKILESVANNSTVSRNELRKVTRGDKTIKRTLTFWEKIGAIKIEKEPKGKLDTWTISITESGLRMLKKTGMKFQLELLKRQKYRPLNDANDRDELRKFINIATSLNRIPQEEWNTIARLFSLWKESTSHRTNLREILKQIKEILDNTLKKDKDYKDSIEFIEWYNRLDYTIKKVDEELS